MQSHKIILSKGALELAKALFSKKTIDAKEIPETRVGDELFAFILFQKCHQRNPSNGMLFNDVLYRMKTTDQILDPLRVFVSDKEFVKIFVKAIVGDEYNVPTIAVLRSANDVDNYNFPTSCCIKPTHASGEVILRKNGESLDIDKIKSWFLMNYYRKGREANYKTLTPKVIVENLVLDDNTPLEYRFLCFNGEAKLIFINVDQNQKKIESRAFFDTNWSRKNFSLGYPNSNKEVEKPKNLSTMLEVANNLAAPFGGLIRIDIYSDGQSCFVGEITNCHSNASQRFIPIQSEYEASNIIFGL